MKIHELKTWPEYYKLIVSEKKTFEYRIADRDFNIGDWLRLKEWDPENKKYTGASCEVLVGYMVHIHGDGNYCIMSIGRPMAIVEADEEKTEYIIHGLGEEIGVENPEIKNEWEDLSENLCGEILYPWKFLNAANKAINQLNARLARLEKG